MSTVTVGFAERADAALTTVSEVVLSILTRRIPYDRRRLLARAEALAPTWRWRHALRLYRQVLAAEPDCIEVHAQAAPLLARAGRKAQARESFRMAAESYAAEGDARAAYGLRQEAFRSLPDCAASCRALALAELERGRRKRALTVLLAGSKQLARRAQRGEAILLLRTAREIERWHPSTLLALARHVARDGFPGEALFLLDHLDDRVTGDELCRVRALAFRIEPSLRHAWRWWRAARERPRRSPASPQNPANAVSANPGSGT